MKVVALFALTGCVDFAHTTMHNAPPNIDLATPLPHENGAPARDDHAFLPTGSTNFALIAVPYVRASIRTDPRRPDGIRELGHHRRHRTKPV